MQDVSVLVINNWLAYTQNQHDTTHGIRVLLFVFNVRKFDPLCEIFLSLGFFSNNASNWLEHDCGEVSSQK